MQLIRSQETYTYVVVYSTTFVVKKQLLCSCVTLKILFDYIGSKKEVERKFTTDSFVTAFQLLFCF